MFDRDCPWFIKGYKLGLYDDIIEMPKEDITNQEMANYKAGYARGRAARNGYNGLFHDKGLIND